MSILENLTLGIIATIAILSINGFLGLKGENQELKEAVETLQKQIEQQEAYIEGTQDTLMLSK